MEKPTTAINVWTKLELYWPTLVWLLFAMTLLLRLTNLSQIPISADEAERALQATRIANGQTGLISDLPIYTGLTAVLFFIFGDANFWSRILPILVGSSLVFLPTQWRDKLDTKQVLILSLAFGLLPTATYFSRTIDAPVFATAAVLWLISLVRLRRWVHSGIAAAFLWLSGSFAVPLSLFALVVILIAKSISDEAEKLPSIVLLEKQEKIQFGSAFFVSLVLISTSLFLNPAGLGSIGTYFTTFPLLFKTWQPSELTRSIFLLLQYAAIPLALHILGWIQINRNSSDEKQKRIVCLIMESLCLVLSFVNAGFLLPFSVLVWAIGIAQINIEQNQVEQKRTILLPLVGFGTALLVYISIVSKTWTSATYNALALGLATGAGLLLFALAHGFVALGWSPNLAKRAALISLSVVLLAGTLSVIFRTILAEPAKASLHWQTTLVYPDSLLKLILIEFQNSSNFEAGELLFRANSVPAAAYEWITRDFTSMKETQLEDLPQVIISATDKPGSVIENSYRGMALSSAEMIDWQIVLPKQIVAGLFGSDLPVTTIQNYLWVVEYFFSGN